MAGEVSYFLSRMKASDANLSASYLTMAQVRDEALPILSWCRLATKFFATLLFYKQSIYPDTKWARNLDLNLEFDCLVKFLL